MAGDRKVCGRSACAEADVRYRPVWISRGLTPANRLSLVAVTATTMHRTTGDMHEATVLLGR